MSSVAVVGVGEATKEAEYETAVGSRIAAAEGGHE